MDPLDDYDDIDALNEESLVYLERRFPNQNRELFNDLLALTDGDVEDVVRLLSMYPDKPKQTPAPRNNITDVNVPTNNTEHKEGPDSDSDIEIVAIRTGPVGTPSRKKQKHKLQRDKQHPAPSSSSSSLLQTSDSTAQSCSIPLVILDGDDNDSPISKPVASNSSQSSRRSISARPDPNPTEFGINYVSEMFPDCAPEFICEIIKSCGGSLEQATDALLKNPSYPKRSVVQLGKRKRTDDIIDDDTDLTAVNENEVKSAEYTSACKHQLSCDFPNVPLHYINIVLKRHKFQYVPSFLHISSSQSKPQSTLPYKPMKQPRIVTILQNSSNELQLEIAWLQRWKEKKRKEEELEKREQAARDRGETIDCGCCFADYLFEKMVACEDGHLFCVDCARRNAETIIGYRKTKLKCMSGDDCSFCFPMNEIKRFLPPILLQGYMRILQEDEIKAAGLEGYKDCPQCYFGAVVDESEKIFACQNPECMFVSCINCRKKNHIPMTCDEYEKENAESKKHIIEEAMTEALLRECPNCKKKFYKVDGCNKMTCTCGTLSCYVCRKVVKGYDHFAQGNRSGCPLYDDTVHRNEKEVYEAQQAAIQQIVEKNPELKPDELIIEKDAPKGPTKGNTYYAGNRPQIANHRRQRPNHGLNAAVAAPGVDRNDIRLHRGDNPPIQPQNAHIPAPTDNQRVPLHVHLDRLRRFVNDGREIPPIQPQNAHIPAPTNNQQVPFHVHLDQLRRFVNDGYHGRPNIAPNIPNPYVPQQPVHAFMDPHLFPQRVQERIQRAQESRNTRPPPTHNPRAQVLNWPDRYIDPFPTARMPRQNRQGNVNQIPRNNETSGRPRSRRT